jgi:hypothetical protein
VVNVGKPGFHTTRGGIDDRLIANRFRE